MRLDWRDSLKQLLAQFQAKSASPRGIHHMMVEAADHERDKLSGPAWFQPYDPVRLVDGKPDYKGWSVTRMAGMPSVEPTFRAPGAVEHFDESANVIRDLTGIVRAVPVPGKLRFGYSCGKPSEDVLEFETIANMAARVLMDASDLPQHFLATELCDVFRNPRGVVRYTFGNIPDAPSHPISHGWTCGVLQYPHGVVIDVPVTAREPSASAWLLFLHRLGWKRIAGCPLTAFRASWNGNTEVSLDTLGTDLSHFPEQLAKSFATFSRESFYSILGSKDSPIDVNLASVFAIQLLTSPLRSTVATGSVSSAEVDYSGQAWYRHVATPIRAAKISEISDRLKPQVGLVVVTDVEFSAVLKRLTPLRTRRNVLRVFDGKNTYFIGRLGIANVVLVRSGMGSIGRDASALVTAELIDRWNPHAVVMVGIAFGRDATRQEIGGVLVSESIISYEPQRIGNSANQNRGEMPRAGPVLLNRFRDVPGWTFLDPSGSPCHRQVGPLLSGEKLVDNDQWKKELFDRFPNAIGGEMEGVGLAAAAERKGCEWIVVKAICDWGDGSKVKHHQEFAAAASIDLVVHVLNQRGALDALRAS